MFPPVNTAKPVGIAENRNVGSETNETPYLATLQLINTQTPPHSPIKYMSNHQGQLSLPSLWG